MSRLNALDVAAVTAQPEPANLNSVRGWIHSPSYDLAFFILSPLAGLLVILGNLGTPAGAAVVTWAIYLVGIPHYLSSFTFFLGDENLAYYSKRARAFFLAPVVIFLVVLVLRGFHVPYVVQAVIFTWNIYHVAQQSSGILSIYRRLNGGGQEERNWAHMTILWSNATMAFWYLERFRPLYRPLELVHADLPNALRYMCLVLAVTSAIGYGRRLMQRKNPLSFPEATFICTSLVLFVPYLFVDDSQLATAGMLMGHFIQYLAIVWLLNRRKYDGQTGSLKQQWLGRLSANAPLLLSVLVAMGVCFLMIDRGSREVGMYGHYIILLNSLVLVHFYLDGLLWAFKNPFVRESIGPYITLKDHRVHG